MPPVIGVPFAIGLALFTIGGFGWLLFGIADKWRSGQRVSGALGVFVLVVIPLSLIVRAVLR